LMTGPLSALVCSGACELERLRACALVLFRESGLEGRYGKTAHVSVYRKRY
jgi:hypothetical protein